MNQGVIFSLTVPTASGSMALFTRGFNGTAANGGASFSASFTSPSQSPCATFPDTKGAADHYWVHVSRFPGQAERWVKSCRCDLRTCRQAGMGIRGLSVWWFPNPPPMLWAGSLLFWPLC